MKRQHAIKGGIAALIVVVLALAGCAPPAENRGGGGDGALTLRVSWNTNGYVRLYAARALGLFEKHGVNPEFIRFDSGAASSAAFRSGAVDVGFSGVPGITSMQLNKSDVQVFASEADDSGAVSLVATPDSGIESVKDLAGKKVGTATGTVAYIGLVLALEEAGLDASEVEIVNLAPNTWVPAFKKQEVDAVFAWAPLNYQMLESGGKEIVTLGDYSPNPISWIGRRKFLESKDGGEAAARFIAAMNEAEQVWEEDRDQVIDYMTKLNGVSESVTAQTLDAMQDIPYAAQVDDSYQWSVTNPDNGMNQFFDRFLDVLISHEIFDSRPKFSFNPTPLERAMEITEERE